MNPMMRLALFVLTLVVAIDQQVAGDALDTLRMVCGDQQVDVSRASQLAELVEAARSLPANDDLCSQRTRLALVELNNLVNSDNNVCSAGNIDDIRVYHEKFVAGKSNKGKTGPSLPKVLREMYLSYGFQVSKTCKKDMIGSLMTDSESLLNAQDFERLNRWTSDESSLAKVIHRPHDVDDLVLPVEIQRALLRSKGLEVSTSELLEQSVAILLDQATGAKAKRLQAVCQRRFQPIYRQLILPLISLSRIGFNYKGTEMEAHKEQMKTNKDVHRWYRLLFLCESIANVELLVDSSENSMTAGDKKTVRILNGGEANELRASQPRTGELHLADVGEQIHYEASVQHRLNDLIVDRQDSRLLKLVNKFDDQKSESRRIRSKVARQIFSMMKQFFKSGKVGFFKGLLRKGSGSAINDELAKTIDSYASQMSADGHEMDETMAVSTTSRTLRRKREASFIFCMSLIAFVLAVLGIMFYLLHRIESKG